MKERSDHKKERNGRGYSYYSYGNVAYEVHPDRDHRQDEEKEAKERARLAKQEARDKRIFCAKVIAVILILFVGCVAFMGVRVRVHQEEMALREQKSELEELRSVNAILEAEATEKLDMDYIRHEAKTRLGMSEPQEYQVVYIDVPKKSYTIQYDTEEQEKPSFLSGLLNFREKD